MVVPGLLTRLLSTGSMTVGALVVLVLLRGGGCPEDPAQAEAGEEPDPPAAVTEADASTETEPYVAYQGEDPAYATLNTKPWSNIFIDGKLAGNTPKKQLSIEPGEHEVILECGTCDAPQQKTLVFHVRAGETYTSVSHVFGDGVDANEVVDTVGGAEPAEPYQESDQSYLTINAKPWARIYLDGELVGVSPKKRFAIAPGDHELLLQCGPCGEDQEKTLQFSVAAGETYTSVLNVFNEGVTAREVEDAGGDAGAAKPDNPYHESDQSYMTIHAKPWSSIYLDGKLLGNTPKRKFAITPGEHEVRLVCGPCSVVQEKTLQFNVAAGQTYTSVENVFDP